MALVWSYTPVLQVSVSDVNDNAPFLTSPSVLGLPSLDHKTSGATAVSFNVTLGDPDDWAAGNGPPFTLSVDPEAELGLAGFLKLRQSKG